MAEVRQAAKSATVNPLKMSQPLGASYAFLGMDKCMPVMHGSQGCTSFGLVVLVRHFREAIPLQTTAMNEVSTILGGLENIEKAVLNIRTRAKPALIGICSTGLTETKGDDVDGFLALICRKHPELEDTAIVYVSTPDYLGAFQDGWAKAVQAIVRARVRPLGLRRPRQVNVLPGCHLTPADVEELREIIEAFGLQPIVLPDVSGSLDGHMSDEFSPTTMGGTTLAQLADSAASVATIAIGEQMRLAAAEIERLAGVPFRVFDRLTGLDANDQLMSYLSDLASVEVPAKYIRQRSQLQDAMLDGHFYFGGKRVAVGAEPDLLHALGMWLVEMGAELACAITTTQSPVLAQLPVHEVLLGDLEDLEAGARDCDLMITHSHGRQAAERLRIPFHRAGMPMFDRLGAGHQLSVGYRGTRDLVFTIGNLFLAAGHPAAADSWALPEQTLAAVAEAGCTGAVATPHHTDCMTTE
jgi:nitrogenase molybdenum-iron protein NifN